MSSDDDIPDLIDKSSGEVVERASLNEPARQQGSLKDLTPMACAAPAVKQSTRATTATTSASRLDPSTRRDRNG